MNDLKLLQEAYERIYESSLSQPIYFGLAKHKKWLMGWIEEANHEVHEDGSITVRENIDFFSSGITRLPFNFRYIEGGIDCSGNKLISLEGAPKEIKGDFDCSANEITSLEKAPEYVGGDFVCFNNELTSLKGAPTKVQGNFDCSYNKITSLEGAPEYVGGEFIDDKFSDKDYRDFIKKKKHIEGKLSKDLDVDLGNFS